MNNLDLIVNLLYVVCIVVSFVFGRFIFPKLPEETKSKLEQVWDDIMLIEGWANKFIAYANESPEWSGHEKMNYVVDALEDVCHTYNINLDGEQLYAIAQTCYNTIKHGGNLPDRKNEEE